jgi:hypothetical protein
MITTRAGLRKILNDLLTIAGNAIGAVPRSSRIAVFRSLPRQQ